MATTERKYDLYGPEFRADPQRVFRQMREHDPVLRQPGLDGETPIWFVTRYDDVAAVLLDNERFVRDPRLALDGGGARGAGAARAAAGDREPHAQSRRRRPPAPAPPRDEGVHAEDGRAAAPAHSGDRGRADRRGRVARLDGPLRGVRVPAADHGDRGAARRPERRSGALQGVVGRDHHARARAGGDGALLRPDGRVRRVPHRAVRGAARRSAGRSRQRSARRPGRGGRAHRGGGLRHGRAPDRGRARDDGRPDRQRGRQPALAPGPARARPRRSRR